jgi:N-acetylmuramoyl-L-alanine amidase
MPARLASSEPPLEVCRAVMARFAALALLLLCAVVPVASAHADEPIVAFSTRLEGDDARTVLVMEFNAPVEPRVFTMANPYRVVLDMPNVVFANGAAPAEARGLVSAYRYGLIATGRSRLVIDSPEPLAVREVTSADTSEGRTQVSVHLLPTTRAAFLKDVAKAGAEAEQAPAQQPIGPGEDRKPLIAIDPGHGGIDSGARSASGDLEKDVVLAFGRTLREALLATGRYRVIMTRDDDSFVALGQRVRIARKSEANLFISIHADAISDASVVRGATIYTLSERASDREAEKLAEKENLADVIAGVDLTEEPDEVAGILIDLAHRETKVFSSRFAQTLAQGIEDSVRLNKNPLRSAGFMVLKAPDVPSVLLELGYMSSKEDLKLLTSRSWRDKVAGSMVGAINGFFGARAAAAPTD